MAITKAYGHISSYIYSGGLVWNTDTIKLALLTSGYTFDQSNNEFYSDLIDELAGTGGYTVGGFTLTTHAPTYDATTKEFRFDADDFSVAALTASSPFRRGVIYKSTGVAGTSPLLVEVDFGADQDPGGLPWAVQWPATGVFYIVTP